MRALVALLLIGLTFAGCLAETDTDGDGLSDAREEQLGLDPENADTDGDGVEDGDEPVAHAPQDEPPVPSEHGTPERTESNVMVEREGDDYVAKRIVTVTNGAGDATQATLDLHTTNGGMAVHGWQWGGYQMTATLWARADSEQDARDGLALMDLDDSDALTGNTLALSFRVTQEAGGVPQVISIGGNNGISTGGSLVLAAPADLAWDASLAGTNGGIAVDGISGPQLNGAITNGGIAVNGRFDTMRLDNTNGGIAVSVPTGSAYGYDVSATNTNGGIEIRLPDLENVGPQDDGDAEHKRTRGFESRTHQTLMTLSNTNGGVVVSG